MSIDKNTVARIARLARIRVAEPELEPLASQLNTMLTWMEQLNEVDTSKVEPLTSVVASSLPRREDTVTDGNYPEDILKNAPKQAAGFFVVPKVVE